MDHSSIARSSTDTEYPVFVQENSENSKIQRTKRFDGEYWVEESRVYRRTKVGRKTNLTSLPIPDATPAPIRRLKDASRIWDYSYLRSPVPPAGTRRKAKIYGADLFCGCGGLSLGIQEACRSLGLQYVPAYALDIDKWALQVYQQNLNSRLAEQTDITKIASKKLDGAETESEKRLKKRLNHLDRLDFLVAGPPCQGHSNLNNSTRRNDERNHLYKRVGRFATLFEPKHIIIENVPTIIHDRDRSMEETRKHLVKLGYNVDHKQVDLLSLGVPQRRKRHVLIASKSTYCNVDSVTKAAQVNMTTIHWAIADLARAEAEDLFNSPAKISDENKARIEYLYKHKLYDLPNRKRPVCHQNDEHSYYSMYGRLRYDQPAQTITTGFHSPGQGRYIHPSCKRTLTAHEAARLQYFPDFFDFSGVPYRSALAQMIGNAVPMKLSYVFALALLRGNS